MGFIIKTLILHCRRNPCVGRNHDKIYTATLNDRWATLGKCDQSSSHPTVWFSTIPRFVWRAVIPHHTVDISIWCRRFAESCPWKAIIKHAGVPLSEFDFRAENIFAGKCNWGESPMQRQARRSGLCSSRGTCGEPAMHARAAHSCLTSHLTHWPLEREMN